MKLANILTHRRQWAALAGALLWVGWSVSVVAGEWPFDLAGQVVGTDWIQFHAAGVTLLRGAGEWLYDVGWQHLLQESLLGRSLDQTHAFLNPPLYTVLLIPFAALPYGWSFAAWSLGSGGLLAASIHLLDRDVVLKEYGLLVTFFPVFAAITFGQNGLLTLAIFAGVWFLWSRDNSFAAGLCASVLLYKPQLLVGMVLLWMLRPRRDGPVLGGLVAGGAVLAAMSFVLLPGASREYLDLVVHDFPSLMTMEGFPIWHAHHLRAFWYLLFPEMGRLSATLWILTSLGVLGLFAQWMRSRVEDKPAVFSAAVIVTLLIAPHVMIYDWVILVIPLYLLGARTLDELRLAGLSLTAGLWIVLLIAGPFTLLQWRVAGRALQVSVPALAAGGWLVFGRWEV